MRRPPIVEVKRRLDGSETRFACQAALVDPGRRAVIVYVLDRAWDVPGVALRPGMTTFAHFWIDRPFNVYHWLEDDRTVGHYVNIGRCDEISDERVRWTDHAVDVLATPDGGTRVLDEDELPGDADPALRELVARTREGLLRDMPALVAEVERETRRLLRAW